MNKTNRKWISQIVACSFLAMLPIGAYAQNNKTIHGVVKDANGETIIGASVGQKGTKNATVTNIDGEFSISVPDNAVLEISYIGYNNQRVAVGGKSSLEIVLTEDVHKLNELVVVGYGVMKKKDLTGAVGSLAAKDMENTPVANIGQAIQGKIAGLQVVDAGKPGDNVTIKVRGMGSINNCDPLVVIDGVPTDLGINAINMADVERLDVLKDASATAIYGSRGANGVIMITTKKGKEGKGHLSLSANLAVQNATRTPDLLNASQYAALSNEMMNNSGNTANPEWADPSALGKGTDWVDELFRTGYMQNYTLSYSGGSDKAHYYVSGGMLDQTGIVRSVKYRRFTFQENSDAQVQPWLKMTSNITVSADRKQQGSYDMGNTYRALPVFAVKDANGEWTGPEGNSLWYGSARNPIGPTTTDRSSTKGYNLLGNISAEVTLAKWLKLKSTFGIDAKFWYNDSYTPKHNWKPLPVEESSRYKSDNKSFTYLWDNYFIFDHTFAKKHHVGLMAGTSAQWNNFDYLNAQKNVFAYEGVHEMDNGEKMHAIGGNETEWALMCIWHDSIMSLPTAIFLPLLYAVTARRASAATTVGEHSRQYRWHGALLKKSGSRRTIFSTTSRYVPDTALRAVRPVWATTAIWLHTTPAYIRSARQEQNSRHSFRQRLPILTFIGSRWHRPTLASMQHSSISVPTSHSTII